MVITEKVDFTNLRRWSYLIWLTSSETDWHNVSWPDTLKRAWHHSCQESMAWIWSWENTGWSSWGLYRMKGLSKTRETEKTEEGILHWRRLTDMTSKFNTYSCRWSWTRQGKRDTTAGIWWNWNRMCGLPGGFVEYWFPDNNRHFSMPSHLLLLCCLW